MIVVETRNVEHAKRFARQCMRIGIAHDIAAHIALSWVWVRIEGRSGWTWAPLVAN